MTDDISREIRALLKERNAILLAHNYQLPEIQDIADLCGTFYDEELGHHSGDEVDNEILGRLREQRMMT